MSAPTTTGVSALAPLKIAVFRAIWIASIVSNIGGWMQTVGAQWFLVEQHGSATIIALVQTASAVPVLLLGIPAGVIGELLDRRRLLIVVQGLQAGIAAVLAVLTQLGEMTPALLLAFTFLLGAGAAVQLPAYQAIVPDVVPRPLIPQAAALSSIGINIARSIGPAVAGLVIASLGIPFVFALNALSFLVFLVVLVLWRGYQAPVRRAEPFLEATRAGLRYMRHAGVVRRLCIQLAVFIVPASALWALLPLLASTRLGLDSNGYGLLLGALGVGSAGGAFVIGRARARLGTNLTVALGSALYGLGLVGAAVSTSVPVTVGVLLLTGVAWIVVIAVLNGEVQAFLPAWVRSRGLSVYQMVLFGGTAVGAALAGAAGQWWGIVPATLGGGALVVLVAAAQLVWPLQSTAGKGRAAVPLPLTEVPLVANDAQAIDGGAETLVLVRYAVAPENRAAFLAQMRLVGRSRRRTGARRWELYDDRERPGTLIEAFVVGSWSEHLSQHEDRLTEYDNELLADARRLATGDPEVEHLTAAGDSPSPAR